MIFWNRKPDEPDHWKKKPETPKREIQMKCEQCNVSLVMNMEYWYCPRCKALNEQDV
jgi:Zn finger protein HypA/HybF involved in hydrogenase expression|tara:strand:+ start:2171 stop:2341 length:171 start_codon:yes stop_codon:yes gene_type:complete